MRTLLFFLSLASFCYAADRQLVGIDFSGDVYSYDNQFNPVKTFSFWGSNGLTHTNSLAQTPDGLLWTTASTKDSVPHPLFGGNVGEWLVSYQPFTNTVTKTKITGIDFPTIRSMTWFRDSFYAFNSPKFNHFDLYKITKSGQATLLQKDLLTSAQNLASDHKSLYVWGENGRPDGMFEINPETLEVNELFRGNRNVSLLMQALVIDHNKFYAFGDDFTNKFRDALFSVNPKTGEYDVIKSYPPSFNDIRGMQWIDVKKYKIIPEPATLLMGLVSFCLMNRCKRFSKN